MGRERCVGKEEDRLGIDTIAGREACEVRPVRFDRVGRELTVDVGGHRRRALSSVPSSVRARALRLGATSQECGPAAVCAP